MALYVGAVAVSVARPGWLGATPLGVVCAVALKPVIGPYLVWLALKRPTGRGADAGGRAGCDGGIRRARRSRDAISSAWLRCRG